MAKAGRPKIEIDHRIFEGLCRIQCTKPEIAAILNVSESTLLRWAKREYKENFETIHEKYAAGGKMSLRRAQFKSAEAGNATMLIWLGKQYLSQRDKLDVDFDDKRKRAETLVADVMEKTGKPRDEVIELLKPQIPQISELVH